MRNSVASACLWVVPAACLAVALAFWDSSLPLQLAAALFCISYMLAYRRLVRFGVPAWMVLRTSRKPSAQDDEHAAHAGFGG
jgi:hypothetical protein